MAALPELRKADVQHLLALGLVDIRDNAVTLTPLGEHRAATLQNPIAKRLLNDDQGVVPLARKPGTSDADPR